ncbi:TRAP transporter small permease [Shimia aestuarii]|uniref:TRAP transporter small permease protein n=1 Tax=Shimia aestuarii TaxID=254406 RepID=A0A1I4LBV5_9RHOB|nr:TRAP transporter small permease [Shimia aestuarii]SFL88349.1 Tripartite ATP-independent transporter, DctQ component [Shimia aestuarii]
MLKLMERLARLMAIFGGIVLTALVILTCLSILGRSLNTIGHSDWLTGLSQGVADALLATGVGPINGDFELVEAGVAFAIFAFLPVCQLYCGHATVDVFTSMMSRRVNKILITFWDVILSAVIILITARLYEGMMNKMSYGETSFLLQFPVWWAYALSFSAAVVASITAIYCAVARVLELVTGRKFLPMSEGAVH